MTEATSELPQTESHDSDPVHGKPGSLWILWIVLALVVAYPLSLGPVAKFYQPKGLPRAAEILYAPVLFLYTHSPMVSRPLDWYLHLWGVR